jgi:uncharacterized membrane protein YqjE
VDRVTKAELASLKDEAAPILRHAAILCILVGMFVVVGLLLFLLEVMFPKFKSTFEFLELVDVAFLTGLFCIFALYTSVIVVGRLWRSAKHELRPSEPPEVNK